MGAPSATAMPANVAPGETVDISVNLTAPERTGEYLGFWQFENPSGRRFGVGNSGIELVWVKVHVYLRPTVTVTILPLPSNTPTLVPTALASPSPIASSAALTAESPSPSATLPVSVVDFARDACMAIWFSAGNILPCPQPNSDSQGGIEILSQATLEDGSITNNPALAVSPNALQGATIQAIFPDIIVQPGQIFKAIVGCEGLGDPCSVIFHFGYQDSDGVIRDLWAIGEFSDGQNTTVSVDLTPLANQKVRFVLSVTSLTANSRGRALWIAPRILESQLPLQTLQATYPPTATETLTPVQATVTPSPIPTATTIPTNPQPATSFWEGLLQWISNLWEQLFGNASDS